MDQLRAMRVFARVIDTGGFARAAKALDIAPAVATRLVAELEEHLGARLLHRTTRRLTLTDVGEAYLERVRGILSEVDDAAALASAATAQPRGTLRVLSPPGFAVHQLAELLPGFRERYPMVGVELTVQGPVETVDDHHDVTLLVALRELDGGFVARPLATTEVILCAAPGYLARHGTPAHPRDLPDHEVLMPLSPAARRELQFHPAAGGPAFKVEMTRTPALGARHSDTLYAAALAGLGIAGLPSFVPARALRQRELVRVLPAWRLRTIPVIAAMPTRKHLPARTRVFVDYLAECLSTGPSTPGCDPWLRAAGCETCA